MDGLTNGTNTLLNRICELHKKDTGKDISHVEMVSELIHMKYEEQAGSRV